MIIAKTEKKSRHRNISILFRDIAEDSKRINESGWNGCLEEQEMVSDTQEKAIFGSTYGKLLDYVHV